MDNSENPYIPKYISKVPWYQKDAAGEEYLAHQKHHPGEAIDHSLPQAGTGIKDEFEVRDDVHVKKLTDWDSKRDRWHGFDASDWNKSGKKWVDVNNEEEDSDNTDYELELVELGLTKNDLRRLGGNNDAIRDRNDVPSYISNISSSSKLKYDPKSRLAVDPSRGYLNDQNQFVRYLSGEGQSLTKVQQFAWEQNKAYETKTHRQNLENQLSALGRPVNHDIEANLDLNVEANPTLLLKRSREEEQRKNEAAVAKRRALLEKYQSEPNGDKAGE